MTDLIDRLGQADPATFPYDDVLAEFQRLGKHFVPKELLAALNSVRLLTVGQHRSSASPEFNLLKRFLDCALDKWDGKYDYLSYIGLPLLPLPTSDDTARAARLHDRLTLLLVTDVLRFELAAADGQTTLLPRMRPDQPVTAKRCRLSLRVFASRLGVFGLSDAELTANPVAAARRACAAIGPTVTPTEERILQLSMLPVDIIHDEYMFIRVLQSFESTFALMGVNLDAAIRALSPADAQPDAALAAALLRDCAAELHRAASLFSLLATMQVGAFQLFRQFTEGASAIQSRAYKLMEALCRTPDTDRLDSPAYHNVPDVRALAVDGLPNIQQAVEQSRASGELTPAADKEIADAMGSFAKVLSQWRTTHYRLAVRMLGEAPGSGYTEGTPYLKSVQRIPVFTGAAAGCAQRIATEDGELVPWDACVLHVRSAQRVRHRSAPQSQRHHRGGAGLLFRGSARRRAGVPAGHRRGAGQYHAEHDLRAGHERARPPGDSPGGGPGRTVRRAGGVPGGRERCKTRPPSCPQYEECPIVSQVFRETFFLAKISCDYTTNYLQQE